MATPKRILLAVPTASGTMKAATAVTLVNVTKTLEQNGIAVLMHNIDAAEIVTARDMFANILIHSPDLDGLVFVDSDMAFDPRVILRMLSLGADVAAAACPFRRINLETLVAAAQNGGDLRRAVARASEFNVRYDWKGQVQWPDQVENGFCLAAGVGMACAYISKAALVAMVEEKVVEQRSDLVTASGERCWSFFANVWLGADRLGEDYSFCYRWTEQLGRQLWVCLDEEIAHIGQYHYTARYSDLL